MKLKHALGALLLTAALPFSAHAQFEEGDNVLGVGVGLGGGYGIGFTGGGVSQSPALNFHLDHGMGELGPGTWGIGGFLGYKTASYKSRYLNFYDFDHKYTFLVIGARGTWHYNEWHDNKWDTYGGAMLAYKSLSDKDHTNYGPYGDRGGYSSSSKSGIDLGLFLGARYFFTDKIGAYVEAGYGLTLFQIGLAVKL